MISFERFQTLTEDYHFMPERGSAQVSYKNIHDIWYADSKYGMVGVQLYSKTEVIESGLKAVIKVEAKGKKTINTKAIVGRDIALHGADHVDSVEIAGEPVKFELWFDVPSGKVRKTGSGVKWGNNKSYVDPEGFEQEIHAEMSKVAVAFFEMLKSGLAPHADTTKNANVVGYMTATGQKTEGNTSQRQELFVKGAEIVKANGVLWDGDTPRSSSTWEDFLRVTFIPSATTATLLLKLLSDKPKVKRIALWVAGPTGKAREGKTPKTNWPLDDNNPTMMDRDDLEIILKTVS